MAANFVNPAIRAIPSDPVFVVDEAFAVRSMNHGAEALSLAWRKPGMLPEEVLQSLRELTSVHAPARGADLPEKEITLHETPLEKARTYLVQISPLPADSARGWVVVLKDATSWQEQAAARTKALSTLGHEVKTPVTSIRMVLHLLLEEKVGPLTADQRELVAAGHEDCERLLTILQALLELARFEGGRGQLKVKTVSADELLASLDWQAERVPADLPRVLADVAHVTRALKLFGSVVLPACSADVAARVRVERRGEESVRFAVRRATSRALSEAECLRMFEPFAIKTEHDPEKSGLGLAIAREIAVAHGGRASVASDESGMEFYLDLPVAGATEAKGISGTA